MPATLLDIRHPLIRLCEMNRDHMKDYVAMSCAWGNREGETGFVRTTRQNYEKYVEEGIHFEHLPRIFQDAITATKHLDIPYIWIDALCTFSGYA